MRLCLSSLAHLLVLVAVADVALGSHLALFLANASSRANVDQSGTANRVKNNGKPAGEKRLTTTWTKILQYPPDSVEVTVGSRVELHCDVIGNPPPQVYWLTGNEPERQSQELLARSEEASGDSTQWEGLSQVASTYVIDCVRAEDQGLKYCMSLSKNKVQTAATALLVNSKLDNGTKVIECNKETQPTITLYHSWRLALEGTTVILPCRVVGQPTPYLFWIDNLGRTVSPATHARHTVLPSGDLQITDIKWDDMGDFTCKVQSGYTEKSVTTFLYPVCSEDTEE